MIESRQDSEPRGTTKSAPPRPCARIETASCTSTLTESSPEEGEPKPRSDSTTAGGAGGGREGEPAPERERSSGLFGREICERDFWRVAFLAPKAGPEGGVNDRLDRGRVRLGR